MPTPTSDGVERPCAQCGVSFRGSVSYQQYCSVGCRKAATAARSEDYKKERQIRKEQAEREYLSRQESRAEKQNTLNDDAHCYAQAAIVFYRQLRNDALPHSDAVALTAAWLMREDHNDADPNK